MLLLPLAVLAQSEATDPASPVPSVLYRSVFVDTPKGVETGTLEWRAANAEVGRLTRGHIDILKWEAAQDKARASMPAPSGSAAGTVKP